MKGEKGDTGLPGFDGMAGAPGQKVPYLSAILALVVLGFVFYVFVLVLVFVQLYCWIVTTRFVSMCETFLRTLVHWYIRTFSRNTVVVMLLVVPALSISVVTG